MVFTEYSEFSVGKEELAKVRIALETYAIEAGIDHRKFVPLYRIADDRKSVTARFIKR
jgi:hypothetical protein